MINAQLSKNIFLRFVPFSRAVCVCSAQGILDFLLSASLIASFLRSFYVFKIVPMLNADGVVHGNYRCNLSGHDLNRKWVDPLPRRHPTLYYTKQVCRSVRVTPRVGQTERNLTQSKTRNEKINWIILKAPPDSVFPLHSFSSFHFLC